MTDNGKGQQFVYDAWGRLRQVKQLVSGTYHLKSAYRYNGLGYKISLGTDMDNDGSIDSASETSYFVYDDRWRLAGVYRLSGGSMSLFERWVHHQAGLKGLGGSSYIDSLVLRDRDVVTTGGTASSTSDGDTDSLEERVYVLQNWRADVMATAGRAGVLIEWMQYTPYGMATSNPPETADFNGDGGVDGDDLGAFLEAYYDGSPWADVNYNGGVDSSDVEAFYDLWSNGVGGYASPGVCNTSLVRFGYAGYEWDGTVCTDRVYDNAAGGVYHVRNRVYDPEMGRWTRRDPAGYVEGMDLYEYVQSAPVKHQDSSGLLSLACCTAPNCCSADYTSKN